MVTNAADLKHKYELKDRFKKQGKDFFAAFRKKMGITDEAEKPVEYINGKPKLPQRIILLMKARGIKLPPGYENEENDKMNEGIDDLEKKIN
jgi:hypothetical protein